jgi:hypothetical protein
MKNPDRIVTWCLVLVASSFWAKLAWEYFTDQKKDSFFVGPAVFVTGLTMAADALLLLVAIYGASYGILRRRVTIQQAAFKWPLLVVLVGLSFYLETKALVRLFPFFSLP